MSYRVLDVPGDVGLRAEGDTVEECFISAAKGLYSLITDIDKVEPLIEKTIEITDESLESLLISFLNELIFQFDAYGFLGKSINLKIDRLSLKATLKGETFDPQKHERKLLIKAATYHNLKLFRENSLFVAEIIFDI